MAEVRLRSAAVEDVRDIRIFSKARFGADVCRDYVNGLQTRFELLSQRPLAGRSEVGVREGLRSIGYRSHRIYYLIGENAIDVARILHHAQDVDLAFGEAS